MDYIDDNGDLVWEATELDEQIYRVLLEAGLIIPTTEEDVAIVEKAMEGMEIEVPESLKEPPFHLLSKL